VPFETLVPVAEVRGTSLEARSLRDHELASLEGWPLMRKCLAESRCQVPEVRRRSLEGRKTQAFAQSLPKVLFSALRGSSQSSSHLRDLNMGSPARFPASWWLEPARKLGCEQVTQPLIPEVPFEARSSLLRNLPCGSVWRNPVVRSLMRKCVAEFRFPVPEVRGSLALAPQGPDQEVPPHTSASGT